MKLKNLNFAEKYIEKIILGLGAVFCLFVIWFYVLGSPYAVSMTGASDPVQPVDVEKLILSEVSKLEVKIQPNSPAAIPELKIPPYTAEFRERLNRSLLPVDRFTIIMGQPGIPHQLVTAGPPPQDNNPYYVPTPPAPVAMKWTSGFGVLAEPKTFERTREFEQVIGDQKPRDFRWISVSADFDLKQWRAVLASKPPGPNLQMIPEAWWRSKLAIVDVVLQRQVLDQETGRWGPVETVAHVPGNEMVEAPGGRFISYRNPQSKFAEPEADAAWRLARRERSRLARPPFPPLAESVWLPPEADERNLSFRIADEVKALIKEIQEIQTAIKRHGGGTASPAPPAEPARPPTGRPTGRGGVASPATDPGTTGTIATMDLPTLETLLDRKMRQLYILLGVEEPALQAAAASPATPGTITGTAPGSVTGAAAAAAAEEAEANAAQQQDTVRIWQHDISVKEGQTVRYRMIAFVLNPLFFERQVPKDQQKEFYHKLTLASVESEWTQAIPIASEHKFFLTSADPARKTATVEVYIVFGGRYHMESFPIQAGDPIGKMVKMNWGNTERNVSMDVGAVVVALDFDAPSKGGMSNKTTRMIYFDQQSGSLLERTLDEDRNDPVRTEHRSKALAGR